MSQLILEFPLDPARVILLEGGALRVELGNGVALTTSVPEWVRWINTAKLTLTMEVEGSPTDVTARPAPIG
jgi:hypothetical protein